MSKKNQSDRLTAQQKENEGAISIFGAEAKLHDAAVLEVAQAVKLYFERKFTQLTFRHRTYITKKENNEALKKVDHELGQTLFVHDSNIKPDGGIIEVMDDNGTWRVILV